MSNTDRPDKRHDNIQDSDIRLLLYQLESLTKTTENGFSDIKRMYAELDKRVNILEIWKAGIEAADKLKSENAKAANTTSQDKSSNSTDNLIKIIFIILGLLGTALGLVGSGIIKGG